MLPPFPRVFFQLLQPTTRHKSQPAPKPWQLSHCEASDLSNNAQTPQQNTGFFSKCLG